MISTLAENESLTQIVKNKIEEDEQTNFNLLVNLIQKDPLRYRSLPSLACQLWMLLGQDSQFITTEIVDNVFTSLTKQLNKTGDKNIFFVFEKLRMVSDILRLSISPSNASTQIEVKNPIWVTTLNLLTELQVISEPIYYAFCAIHCHISHKIQSTPIEQELIKNHSYIKFLKQSVAALLSSENVRFKLLALGM